MDAKDREIFELVTMLDACMEYIEAFEYHREKGLDLYSEDLRFIREKALVVCNTFLKPETP